MDCPTTGGAFDGLETCDVEVSPDPDDENRIGTMRSPFSPAAPTIGPFSPAGGESPDTPAVYMQMHDVPSPLSPGSPANATTSPTYTPAVVDDDKLPTSPDFDPLSPTYSARSPAYTPSGSAHVGTTTPR